MLTAFAQTIFLIFATKLHFFFDIRKRKLHFFTQCKDFSQKIYAVQSFSTQMDGSV